MKIHIALLALLLSSCASQRQEVWTGGNRPVAMPSGTIDALRGAHDGRLGEYDAVAQKIVGKSGNGPYAEWTMPPRGIQQRYTGRAWIYVWEHRGAHNWHAVRELEPLPGQRGSVRQGGTPAPGFYSARRMEVTEIPAYR